MKPKTILTNITHNSDEWDSPHKRTFSQHKWKEVLNELYVSDTDNHMSASGTLGQYSPKLLSKFGVNVHEMNKINLFLYRRGLVESSSSLELTVKGFEVALQNEKMRNDEKNRDRTLWATCVIAIAAVMEIIMTIGLDVIIITILSNIFY